LRAQVLLVLTEVHKWRGDNAGAKAAAHEARGLLSPGSANWYHASIELVLATASLGDSTELLPFSEYLLRDPSVGTTRPSALALLRSATILSITGEPARAAQLRACFEARTGPVMSDPVLRAWYAWALALDHSMRGFSAAYVDAARDSASLFDQAGDLRSATMQRANAGSILLEVGRWDEAIALLRETWSAARRIDLGRAVTLAEINLSRALPRVGRFDEALEFADRAVTNARRMGNRRHAALAHENIARVWLERGDLSRAEDAARTSIECADGSPAIRAPSLAVLADVLLAANRVDEAFAAANEAYATLTAAKSLSDGTTMVRLAWAECLHALGRVDEARGVLRDANERIENDVRSVDDPGVRAGILEVPDNARVRRRFAQWSG
ncbi:MAG: hypothetical protein WCJ30_14905, partial [Deltaproteobacteria bacterium]